MRSVPTRPDGTRYVQTGTDYRPGTLVRQAKKALAEYDLRRPQRPAVLPVGHVPAGVAETASATSPRGSPVRLVDLARYQARARPS